MTMRTRITLTLGAVVVALAIASAQSTPPQAITKISPEYPAALLDEAKDGQALITFVITTEGTVADPVVISADNPAFGEAALAVLPQWRFKPAIRNGEVVPLKVSLPFVFETTHEQKFNAAMKRNVFMIFPEEALSLRAYRGERPEIASRPKVNYPESRLGSGVNTDVSIRFVVGPDGSTHNPEVIGEVAPDFKALALLNIAQTTYNAPMKRGKGVYLLLTTKIRFEDPGSPN